MLHPTHFWNMWLHWGSVVQTVDNLTTDLKKKTGHSLGVCALSCLYHFVQLLRNRSPIRVSTQVCTDNSIRRNVLVCVQWLFLNKHGLIKREFYYTSIAPNFKMMLLGQPQPPDHFKTRITTFHLPIHTLFEELHHKLTYGKVSSVTRFTHIYRYILM